jgi:PAS domain S-box-containing protein
MRILEPQPKRATEFPAVLCCSLVAALSANAGFLGLVVVILATRYAGKMAGRGAAAGVSVGIAWIAVAHASTLTGTSVSASLIAILAAWLCAEFTRVKRRATTSPVTSMQAYRDVSIHTVDEYESPGATGEETCLEILDRIPACVCVADAKGQLLYVSPFGVATLGKPLEEIIGDQWLDFIHPDNADEAKKRWQRGIAASVPFDLQVRMRQCNDVYRWQHIVAEPFFDEFGSVDKWYATALDIDDLYRSNITSHDRESGSGN